MKSILTIAVLLGLTFSLSSCDTVAPDEVSATFSASISGAFEDELTGTAMFSEGMDEQTGQHGFGIVLTPGDLAPPDASRIVFFRISTAPSSGTYNFVNLTPEDDEDAFPSHDFAGFAMIHTGGQGLGAFWSDEGTLQITHVSENNLRGTFQLHATGALPTGGEGPVQEAEIVIAGEFDATASGVFSIPFEVH